MKKCYYKFARLMAISAAVGVFATSCSDEGKDYMDDVYFTGSQSPVVVAAPTATGEAGVAGSPAFNVNFDASSNWQIAAKDFADPSQTADWVSFFTNSGEEGCQMLGTYLTANTTGKDRAATIEVSCNGKTVAFTLVQQAAAPIANPNAGSINKNRTVSRIEYYSNGETVASRAISFTYDSNGQISAEETTLTEGENVSKSGYTVTITRPTTGATAGINKVTISPDNNATLGNVYGVIDSKTAIGYNTLSLLNNTSANVINFDYNQLYLGEISGAASAAFQWSSNNLTGLNANGAALTAAYGNTANDCNIDLNWYVGLDAFAANLPDTRLLGAMNLLGLRSANLVSSNGNETFTYTSGVTDNHGEAMSGLTVNTSSNRVIKVFFQ
ncbi:MAG: hypothetical protein K2L39_08640 [Muribaculaceae bacterium]|nr:hypothetical protein [Muribaculaceae bacterium]